jgi:hypothetical protein
MNTFVDVSKLINSEKNVTILKITFVVCSPQNFNQIERLIMCVPTTTQ